MLPPTDQGHLRKYLATLGVAIVVASLAIGGFILQTQSDLLVEQSKINSASPTGRAALEKKQHLILLVMDWSPLVLGLLSLFGIALAIYGLRGWSKRQEVLDAKDRLDVEKTQAELDGLRASAQVVEEEKERAINEVLDEEPGDALREAVGSSDDADQSPELGDIGSRPGGSGVEVNGETPDIPAGKSQAGRVDVSNPRAREAARVATRQDIELLEGEFTQKLAQIFGARNVVAGAEVRKQSSDSPSGVFLDAVAIDPPSKAGFAFELKLNRHAILSNFYHGLIRSVVGARDLEDRRSLSAIKFTPVLVIVLSDETSTSKIQSLKMRLNSIVDVFIKSPKVLVYKREQFASLTSRQLYYDLNLAHQI